jgi:YfdX protein
MTSGRRGEDNGAWQNALTALDQGDKNAALAALERASGKLDLIVSRDPKLVLAPVDVTVSVLDLHEMSNTIKPVAKLKQSRKNFRLSS